MRGPITSVALGIGRRREFLVAPEYSLRGAERLDREDHLMQALPAGRTRQPSAGSTILKVNQRAAQLVSRVPLGDGLRICLSLAEDNSPSFGLAALHWHSCFCSRAVGISLREAQDLLSALDGLRGARQRVAGEQLRNVALRYQQAEAVEVLDAWVGGKPIPSP